MIFTIPARQGQHRASLDFGVGAGHLDLAAAYALETPGGFAVKRDYGGEPVLMVSRPLAYFPWMLVRKISRAEALAASESRLRKPWSCYCCRSAVSR
ncbi:MAG: hypothetical protein HC814_04810 [Rhodobacteraceae bacterium]|nr:hypothetical protein [Paracoccaceae bacterium]